MDLRQLRYFIALNEHRSFVRAADAMGITQPAFSRSIQGLEQEFGCVLVDRGNKDLRPTPEGQVVLQHALTLVQGAALLSAQVTQMTKLDAGEVRFGCGSASAVKLVPDAVAQFVSAHPKVRTCFQVDNWEKLSRALSREEIEFFIADIRHFEADPNFQTRALTPKRGVFFCRPGHPLLAKESLSTNDMFDYPLATTLIPPGIRKLLANLSGRTDFPDHRDRASSGTGEDRAAVQCDWRRHRRSLCRRHRPGLTGAVALAQPGTEHREHEHPLRDRQSHWLSLVTGGAGTDRNVGGGG